MTYARTTNLPHGTLSSEVQFAAPSEMWKELNQRLFAAAPNESCAFVLSRPSRGVRRTTCLLGEILWPQPGDVEATPHSLDISADFISRAIDAAIDAGELVGLTLIHTHPKTEIGEGVGRFSPRDDWYENRLFPTITLGRRAAVSGSIVIGSEGCVDGRVWWQDGSGPRVQRATIIRTVGPEVRFLETPYSTWTDHPDPSIMDRSTRLWGASGRRILQNLRVGVVGAGGTGSIVLASLATMGVGKIDVWDNDTVKTVNLHRMLGTTRAMVGENKATALSEWLRIIATSQPFQIVPFESWATSANGLTQLKDCDIAFCCVDRFAPRVPLNQLAYAHLIPTIDMASWLHADADGTIDAIMTHAHVWSPGIPCAWCRETITSRRLTREAQGAQRDAEHRLPYGLSFEATDGVEPSVLPLNMAGVSLALLEFLQVALRVTARTPRDLKLFLPEWELDESDLGTVRDCDVELNVGLGDTVAIRSVTPSAMREKSVSEV